MKLIGGDIQELYTGYFNEAANLIGTDVFYEAVDTKKSNLYNDKKIEYLPKIQLSILLQQHPTIKTLKSYGWYKHDEDINPIIAFLPFTLCPTVEVHARISFESHIGNRLETFEVKELTTHYTYPSHWICKLIPYILDTSVIPEAKTAENYGTGQYVPKPK